MTCPTLCDADCEAPCHEVHLPRFKREHDVDACEERQFELAAETRYRRMIGLD